MMKLYIGPCVLESEELSMEIAGQLKQDLAPFKGDIELNFKGSFDKANRTSIDSFRGPGLEKGLKILEKIKKEFSIPVVTDIHLPEQADSVASVVDTVQIPAFLCRQTDMIVAAAKTCKKYDRNLSIKKGQFLAPADTKYIINKANSVLSKKKILLLERGTSFGYNNLIVDMASFMIMKSFGVSAIYDATHSVQMPGGLGNITGGKREQVMVLAKAAMAAGSDGVFIETHPNPDKALCDSTTCLKLDSVKELISKLLKIYKAVQ